MTNNGKNKIFISHSNPEDNYFAFWLSVKLKQCGYDVWVDINDLKSGELWNRVHKTIRNESIKFLACISKDYIRKSQNEKSGVYKELAVASTVDVNDFMLPIMVDNSDWNDIPIHGLGFLGKDFSKNWATGLKELLEAIEEENIPKNNTKPNLKNFWYEALQIESEPIKKTENYYTNWFKIDEPQKIYIHGLYNDQDISIIPNEYPFVRVGNVIISFFDVEYLNKYVNVRETREEEFKTFVEYEQFGNEYMFYGTHIHQPNWKVLDLLRKTFKIYFTQGDFFSYEFSNRLGFFNSKKKNYVSLKHLNKTGKAISGTAFENFNWFYGVSFNFATYPELYFKVSNRVIFSDKSGKLVSNEEQHAFRRKFCSNWYNKQWLDLLLAFFAEASLGKENFLIPVGKSQNLVVSSIPMSFTSKYGYKDPNE